MTLGSPRLGYVRLSFQQIDEFHAHVVDPYVRRFLLDGEVMGRDWCAARAAESEASFATRGVGLWLVRARESDDPVGFCGFLGAPDSPRLALHYALRESFAGRGLAAEMARAALAAAATFAPEVPVVADVDEANTGSVRLLEKLGFVRVGEKPGVLGVLFDYELPPSRPPRP